MIINAFFYGGMIVSIVGLSRMYEPAAWLTTGIALLFMSYHFRKQQRSIERQADISDQTHCGATSLASPDIDTIPSNTGTGR